MAMLPEVQNYLERLDDLFAQVGTLVAGLSAEALNWRPIEGADIAQDWYIIGMEAVK